jgi:hypothetical protein
MDINKEVGRKLKEKEIEEKDKCHSEMETMLKETQAQPKKGTWWFF